MADRELARMAALAARVEAFQSLADRHLDASYRLAQAILGQRAEAEDIGAAIEGEGMDNIGGVWATDDPSGRGSIFAVSRWAQEFSSWPDRPELGIVVDRLVQPHESAPDGFFEADECARPVKLLAEGRHPMWRRAALRPEMRRG